MVDQTQLSGMFNVVLDWVTDRPEADSAATAGAPRTAGRVDVVQLDFVRALEEQAGLKLTPKKAPVEFLIVDQAERLPVEN